MQICPTLPGKGEVGAPLLKCIDVHFHSKAPPRFATTLMKLSSDLSYWEFFGQCLPTIAC